MFLQQINFKSSSVITLIGGNVLLLGLAISMDWELFDILLIYWAESLVIGLFSVFKMLRIRKKPVLNLNLDNVEISSKGQVTQSIGKLMFILKMLAIGFFAFIFFLFCMIQMGFIYVLFGDFSLIEFVLDLAQRKFEFKINDIQSFAIGSGIIFLSHTISFFINFIGKKEYEKTTLKKLLIAPFKRIILVWTVIGLGSLILVNFGNNSVLLLIPFFAAKIFFDLRQHYTEHKVFM